MLWTKYAFSTENVVLMFTTAEQSQIMKNTETPLPYTTTLMSLRQQNLYGSQK